MRKLDHFASADIVQWKAIDSIIMSRVNDALSTLVKALLPSAPQESESSAKTRHHEGLDLAKSILEK